MKFPLWPVLVTVLVLTPPSCKSDKPDFKNPSPAREPAYGHGMSDAELLKVASERIESKNYDDIVPCT